MPDIVVVGGGMVGLSTAMLLAADGHRVTVLERDPAPVPEPAQAWASWDRRGVNQFRLPHFLAARFRQVVEAELPEVAVGLEAAGAVRYDFLGNIPVELTGPPRPGDGELVALTGRRPVVEAAVASVAESTAGVTVRRGVPVTGLLAAPSRGGVPHVTGVRTGPDDEIRADLVVDAAGRRSALPGWIAGVGGPEPREVGDDSGFMYFGRHFRSRDGGLPVMLGPLVQECGSLTALTLPADNGTWSVVVVTAASDVACRGLRDPERWEAVVRTLPSAAHWLAGEPIDDGVAVMTRIADRRRWFVDDDRPAATGVLAVGDSWACTNPSLGRGASIALLHAVALRDTLRGDDGDPAGLVARWASVTDRTVGAWYEATNVYDRHRLREVDAMIAGVPYETSDPFWERSRALAMAAGADPGLLRALIGVASVCVLPEQLFDDPAVLDRITSLGSGWRDLPQPGPTRQQLLSTLAA